MKSCKSLGILLLLIAGTFVYNEYLIYWHTLFSCKWPSNQINTSDKLLNIMLISDTHLLGSRNGHWFDKLRREWQQHRAFQTAQSYLDPDYIVILGDLTDEGKWCSDWEWDYYEKRAAELFYVTGKTKLIVVAGNHDVGFHYDMIDRKIDRFNRSFQGQLVQLYQPDERDDVNFLVVNSMALQNDECKFCKKAQKQLKHLNKTLQCLKYQTDSNYSQLNKYCKIRKNSMHLHKRNYSRPIVFTHFPLYRKSDQICPQDVDSETIVHKVGFKENFDCLSKDSTEQLIELVNPRLVFNGHTHFSCVNNIHGIPEYTLASFSWRNINNPSLLLLQLNEKDHYIRKCLLPSENTVFMIYSFNLIFILAFFTILKVKSVQSAQTFDVYKSYKKS